MNEDDAIEAFERLGLTGYEAKVFVALQKLGSGTARDVHRVADVPRSQVYSAAESLEERGLLEIQQSSPMRYRPASVQEARSTLAERFEREQERAFEYVEAVRQEVEGDEQQEDIWTVRGSEHVADRAANLVEQAEEWVVYAARSRDLLPEPVEEALRTTADEGLAVTVLSEDPGVRSRFDDHPGVDAREPADPHKGNERSGRAVFADGDILLLSVLGEVEVPGFNRETAVWSAHTNFATVLIQLIQASEEALGA